MTAYKHLNLITKIGSHVIINKAVKYAFMTYDAYDIFIKLISDNNDICKFDTRDKYAMFNFCTYTDNIELFKSIIKNKIINFLDNYE